MLLEPPSDAVARVLLQLVAPSIEHGDERLARIARLYQEADGTELAREWTRLFIGPRAAPCRPWHDTWEHDGPPRLMGLKHASMAAFWRRAGLEPANAGTEPADHAGLILALFSALAQRAAAGEDVRALLEELWHAHIASWMPRFASTLVAEARVDALEEGGKLLLWAVSPAPQQ